MKRFFSSIKASFPKWTTISIIALITLSVAFIFLASWQFFTETYCNKKYNLINPRWRCISDNPPKSREYDALTFALTERIEQWEKDGEISIGTVYFRDLTNGVQFGIQSQERFAPASLLKVPVMIALYEYSEDHPGIFEERIAVGDTVPTGQNVFDPNKTLLPKNSYTIREAMRRMILYSDNTSKELLRQELEKRSPGIMEQIFIDLGIAFQNPDGSQYITVRSYASLFRTLYNASYIDRNMSEEALQMLLETDFEEGLKVGVPKEVPIAHKFGYIEQSVEGQMQLHDCGIVYFPETHYLLCVMTRGKDVETLKEVIGDISKMIFDEVSRRATQ